MVKKGAMFGLDARIALAIFGALSVISGAALYSAIQSANSEKFRQVFREIVKASEQYYLDNGKPIPRVDSNSSLAHLNDLIKNRESLTTWNGPYISGEVETGSYKDFIKNNISNSIDSDLTIEMRILKQSDWTANTSIPVCSISSYDCVETILFYTVKADINLQLVNIFNNLDSLVDNSDGPLKGTIRAIDYTSSDTYYLVYMGDINRIRK